jgi:metal-dependent amidase/aminoacylase/carboxypeptidase family protein
MRLTGKLALLLGLLAPLTAQAASDEQKEFAYSVIERNAAPMAKIGDSIYYFAELGMQEFESIRLMKDVLEAGGFTVQRMWRSITSRGRSRIGPVKSRTCWINCSATGLKVRFLSVMTTIGDGRTGKVTGNTISL